MNSRKKKVKFVISAIAVAVVVILTSIYAFYDNPKSEAITVSQKDASYTWVSDFFVAGNQNPMHLNKSNFTSSALITEKGGDVSTLNSSILDGNAYGNASGLAPSPFFFSLTLRVSGILHFNILPSTLNISVAPLPGSTSSFESYINNNITQGNSIPYSGPDNVSVVNFAQRNLSLRFYNDSGLSRNQSFHFSTEDQITGGLQQPYISSALEYNTTYGMSITASLTGLPKPVSTNLYLFFIIVPGYHPVVTSQSFQ